MKEISLKISDIDCAACVERLNRAISAVNGVRDAAVNYASGRALISYDEGAASIASIAAAVKKAGFGVPADSVELKCPALDAETMSRAIAALRALEEVQSVEQNAETGGILVRVWPVNPDSRRLLAALCEVGVWAELGEMTSGEEESEVRKRLLLLRLIAAATLLSVPLVWEMHYLVQFVIATLIQFWPGMYFYRGAWRGLRNGTMNMDVLVALSTTIIYLYSSYVGFTVPVGKMLYFLSDGVLIALLLFGRYLEQLAMGESSQAIRRLMRLRPKTALVQRGGDEPVVHRGADEFTAAEEGGGEKMSAYTTEILDMKLGGMVCRSCEDVIAAALLAERGVVDADVSYYKSAARVKYDPAIVTPERLEQCVKNAGYGVGGGVLGGAAASPWRRAAASTRGAARSFARLRLIISAESRPIPRWARFAAGLARR